jgi:hypothetical protein
VIRIRCLVCREAFRWDATHGMPDNCPICREYIGSDGKDEVAAPFISMAHRKGPDRLYRDMEAKSEYRAQQAAAMAGMSAAEVSHLKMTDMKDGLREGDTAFKPIVNDVTRAMDTAPQQTGFAPQAQQIGLMASQGTRAGPYPRAGMGTIQALRQTHNRELRGPVSDMTGMGIQVPGANK